MMKLVLALLLCVSSVLCAVQKDLYPLTADGFDTVFLDDMSFVNEINIQTYGEKSNLTYYTYGQSRIRTVYPGRNFYVGSTPHEDWHIPFIDFHTVQNGSDVWGFGPVDSVASPFNASQPGFGYQFEIAVTSSKNISATGAGHVLILTPPADFGGTFYCLRISFLNPVDTVGYFVGFFSTPALPAQLHFGVVRVHFNMGIFNNTYVPGTPGWSVNTATDVAVIYPNAHLVSYNGDFKPLLFHVRNISAAQTDNWLVVVDPYWSTVSLIDTNLPLSASPVFPIYRPFNRGVASIVSAAVFRELLFVGISSPGFGTGWIEVIFLPNVTVRSRINLPTNYSDPRSLVVDYFDEKNPTLYVGMNGGRSLLKIDISSLIIVGYQPLPYYLHRTWTGAPAPEHIYFATNEQHSKVYRVAKQDFCNVECMEFAYCKEGRCVCPSQFTLKDGKCEWRELIVEKNTVKKEKGGEIALGFFFALATVAAGAGWYLVWKSKRNSYQSV